MPSRLLFIAFFFAGSLFAQAAANLISQTNPEWVESFPPHRIIGNIYYVGSKDLAHS
jgi:metallo-beta-lactamase class B